MNRTGLIVGGAALVVLGATLGWAASRLTGKDREEGRQLYVDACASCHGDDGKGQVSGLGVKVPLPDFTWCAFNSEETDRDWTLVVAEGG
ncbi:c-type cytochrome, partial [bacterium]